MDDVDWNRGLGLLRARRLLRGQQTEVLPLEWGSGAVLPTYLVLRLAAHLLGAKFREMRSQPQGLLRNCPLLVLTSGLSVVSSLHGRVECYIPVSEEVARDCDSVIRPGRPPIDMISPFLLDGAFESVGLRRPAFPPTEEGCLPYLYARSESPQGARRPFRGVGRARPWDPDGAVRSAEVSHFGSLPPAVIVGENVPRPGVLRAWAQCLASVEPAIWSELRALVATEAVAAGRRLAISAAGGRPDIVADGETGVLVRPGRYRNGSGFNATPSPSRLKVRL